MSPGPAAPPRPPSWKLFSLIGLMAMFWSLNFIIGKVALREFPALLAGCLRTSIAGLLVLPLYLWKRGHPAERWDRRQLPRLLFLGLIGVGFNQLCFLLGLGRTSVGHASILIATSPMMVLLLASALGHERLTARKITGMAIAAAGAITLQIDTAKDRQATLSGDLLMLLAALTFASFTVFGKQATRVHGPLTINVFAYAGSGLMLAPLTLSQAAGFAWEGVSAAGWASLLYMSIFPSVIAYMIFYYALTWIPASRLASFGYVQPFLTTLLAVLLLGDPVTRPLVTGGALVLTGVWVAERA